MRKRKTSKVLVVEDNEGLRLAVSCLLEPYYQNDIVGSFLEAKRALEQMNYCFLITDFQLPDGDGLDVAMEFREVSSEAPIILMSACSPSENPRIQKILAMTNAQFLKKPFLIEDLMQKIESTDSSSG